MDEKLQFSKKLIKICRENGISLLKTAEFEIQFSPAAFTLEEPKTSVPLPAPTYDPQAEEENLFWSSDDQIPAAEGATN